MTLVPHLASQWARQGKRVTLIDADHPQARLRTGRKRAPAKA
jgi:cellulose biosynthesis protein BcsQ